MTARALTEIESLELQTRPVTNGYHDEYHQICELILDNWRHFTDVQRGIAATVMSWRFPAERVSGKQRWHLEKALEAARQLGLLANTAIEETTLQ